MNYESLEEQQNGTSLDAASPYQRGLFTTPLVPQQAPQQPPMHQQQMPMHQQQLPPQNHQLPPQQNHGNMVQGQASRQMPELVPDEPRESSRRLPSNPHLPIVNVKPLEGSHVQLP